jgi:hypothetical protein
MTIREVVNKLALELAFKTGNIENMRDYKNTIQMAVVIGTEHFTKKMEEVVAMTRDGVERGRFKSVDDAANKLDIPRGNIFQVLERRRATAHGYKFIYVKDLELFKRTEESKLHDFEDNTNKTVMDFNKLIK